MINNHDIIKTIFNFLSVKGVGNVQANRFLQVLNDCSYSNVQEVALGLLKESQKKEYEGIKNRSIDVKSTFNVEFIHFQQDIYPNVIKNALKINSPPVISIIGNKELLHKKKVAFSGSRNVSEKGLQIARDAIISLTPHNIAIVSGYAKGVDFTAHYTALETGGSTIIVLPEGINHFRIKRELKEVWDWERVLVISEFLPFEKWLASRAMRRNATIIGLSDAVIVVEAGETGGSLDAGHRALEMNKPLFVTRYSNVPDSALGNPLLLKKGARSLQMSKNSGMPNIDPICESFSNNDNYRLF